jgi:transcriptional regulator of acetoin/glycerol metabolism/DNA-binding CsgD family transcriptional regulator
MSTRSSNPERLRSALETMLHGGEPRADVRDDIWTSWRRSASSGLSPNQFTVPHTGDGDRDGLLVQAARPVLSSLTDDLASTNVGLLLTGRDGDILDRWVPERSLGSRFDRVHLAPGFVYTEPAVGTNAIGTSIAQRLPSLVRGSEHFADALTALACAAAPIMDPRTGNVLGVIDLTCSTRDASTLMLALARRAAREIEERLVDDGAIAERVMMRQFLRKRRGSKHPMVFANQRIVLANTAAEGLVNADDEPLLRHKAEEMMATAFSGAFEIALSSGTRVAMRCEPILDGGSPVGVVMHLDAGSEPRDRPLLGLGSLTDTEHSVANLVAEGLTNRQIAERVFISRHTVDFHLRSIYRKVGVASRVELAREVIARPAHRGG